MREVSDVYNLMKELERRSKIIRSSRIEASKRYKEDDNFYRFITIFYSIIVTVVSIRFAFGLDTLNPIGNQKLSILLLVMSVFVTLFTMYVSIKNAGEKVGRFQSNYMELTRLLADIQLANTSYTRESESELEIVNEDYKKFSNRYASLLTQSDNHDDIDYWRAVKREEEENTEKVKIADEKIKVFKRWKYLKRVVAFLSVPLLLVLIFLIEFCLNYFW
ncbi:SLATT domain-containing protein [Metabacillus litoralis]|uniref:SLATT domain-containing protein n=1 Tax=Metabacillus litoralis TaxID=152268 RepID=UPI001CFEBA5B|nr:SLATT domain-containing protein [Metabacillus litoralis]